MFWQPYFNGVVGFNDVKRLERSFFGLAFVFECGIDYLDDFCVD
jgi:hypothetical protein